MRRIVLCLLGALLPLAAAEAQPLWWYQGTLLQAAGGGGLGGSLGSTDEVLLRSNGTGGALVQGSSITLSDTTGVFTQTTANTGFNFTVAGTGTIGIGSARFCGGAGALRFFASGVEIFEGCASGNRGNLTLSLLTATSGVASSNNMALLDAGGFHVGESGAVAFKLGETNGAMLGRERSVRRTTTDATQSELFRNGTSTRMTLSDDSTWVFECRISARRTDANDESAGYRLEGVIDRNTGAATTSLVGSVTKTVLAEDSAAWDVEAIADSTNGALVVRVTGEASKTILWVAICKTVEATG